MLALLTNSEWRKLTEVDQATATTVTANGENHNNDSNSDNKNSNGRKTSGN